MKKKKLTQEEVDKINNRYRAKFEEFKALTKEEIDELAKRGKYADGKSMSSTDKVALMDVMSWKIRQEMKAEAAKITEEENSKEESLKEVNEATVVPSEDTTNESKS